MLQIVSNTELCSFFLSKCYLRGVTISRPVTRHSLVFCLSLCSTLSLLLSHSTVRLSLCVFGLIKCMSECLTMELSGHITCPQGVFLSPLHRSCSSPHQPLCSGHLSAQLPLIISLPHVQVITLWSLLVLCYFTVP